MRKLDLPKHLKQVRNLFLAQPEKVLLEHVPKCGGTTVTNYLKSQYAHQRIFSIDGSNPSKSIELFMSLPEKRRHLYDLVHGHGANRLRQYIHQKSLAVTILRDPVERIISHYYYVCRSPKHYLFNEVTVNKMSLIDYATSSLSGELRNNYVCRFLQISAEEAESTPDESINSAYSILRDKYAVVGIMDNIDSAMKILASKASFRDEYKDKKLNVTIDRPKQTEIEQSTLDAIAEVNQLDVRLYDLVKKHLAQTS
jgi:hypothetical protein